MFEPQKLTEPTIAAKSDGMTKVNGSPAKPLVSLNSAQAISATAPPPTPLKSATICGTAVILTLRAEGIPMIVPMISAMIIRTQLPIPSIRNVASNAMPIPTPAMRLPRTAVRGPVSPLSP